MAYAPPPLVRPTSGYGVASLVLGILSWLAFCIPFVGFLLALVGVLLGHMGLKETKHGHKNGHGLTIAGLILGYIGVAPSAFFTIMAIVGSVSGA
jgi:Domain of unknown function (DUF4190)